MSAAVAIHFPPALISLTDAEREGTVPRPPLPPQAGEHLGAPQRVPRVTAVRHHAPCKMTPVLPLVAELGDAWILTLDQLETLKTDKKKEKRKSEGQMILPPWLGKDYLARQRLQTLACYIKKCRRPCLGVLLTNEVQFKAFTGVIRIADELEPHGVGGGVQGGV